MIAPRDIVQNIVNGAYYRVRSVSRAKAIVRPCGPRGGKPEPGRRAVAVECKLNNLRLVRSSREE